MPAITLHTFVTSPFAAKVKCYLDYKRLEYQLAPVDPVSARELEFTGQRQVPVLEIDGEWRRDSSAIGHWLDERFPEPPLLGTTDAEREVILAADQWVSESLIPAGFRTAADWRWWHPAELFAGVSNGWRLAGALNCSQRLAARWRWLWPLALQRAAFIRRILARNARRHGVEESVAAMWQRVFAEFEAQLAGGPFLGGQLRPSLADLGAYPQFIFPRRLGVRMPISRTEAAQISRPPIALAKWLKRMERELPEKSLLID